LALGSIFAGDFAEAERLLESLEPVMGGLPEPQRAKLEAISISIDFGLERFERVLGVAPRWLDQHPKADPRFRAIAAVSLFWSCLAQLDTAGSERALARARAEIPKADARFLEAWLVICDAAHRWDLGRVSEADSVLSEATASGVIDHTMNLIRSAIAWEKGDEPRARQLTAASLRQGARHTVVETAYLGWTTAARIATRDGGLSRGLKLLQEAETTMASRHGERARRLVRLFRGKLLLQNPDEGRGGDLGAELEAISRDSLSLGLARGLDEAARLTLARWRVLQGQPRSAISLVQPIVSAAHQQGRLRVWGEANLIYASGLVRLDEPDRAARMAWHAIEQLAAIGLGAAIWEEQVLLAPLLDDLLTRARIEGAQNGDLHRIFERLAVGAGRAWAPPRDTDDPAREPTAAAELTDMERRLLSLVAQGLSNADLAERLLVQVSTVKWHLHNAFGKLGVRSRTAALAEARRLGLVA
jgi:LuxR family maltose regulon positive regulatory protein